MNRISLAKPILLALVAFMLLVPAITQDAYCLHVLIMIGLHTLLVASLRLTIMAGLWNLAQIAFYAIGAYTLMVLVLDLGMSFWLAAPLAGVATVPVALGLGYITVRVTGFYFCMLSLVFVEITRLSIRAIPFLGAFDPRPIPPPNPIVIPHFIRVEFVSKVPYYYLVFVMVVVALAILYRLERSRLGSILKSMAQSEDLTKSIGVDVVKYRVIAFMVCSFVAGIAGAFWSSYATIIGPEDFNLAATTVVFAAVIVGGVGSLWGAVIGAAFFTVLPEFLRLVVQYKLEPSLYAVALLLAIYFLPQGLVGLPGVARANLSKLGRTSYENH